MTEGAHLTVKHKHNLMKRCTFMRNYFREAYSFIGCADLCILKENCMFSDFIQKQFKSSLSLL